MGTAARVLILNTPGPDTSLVLIRRRLFLRGFLLCVLPLTRPACLALLLLALLRGRLARHVRRGPRFHVDVQLVRHLVGILVVIQVQQRTAHQQRGERHRQHAGVGVVGRLGRLFFVFASHDPLLLPVRPRGRPLSPCPTSRPRLTAVACWPRNRPASATPAPAPPAP